MPAAVPRGGRSRDRMEIMEHEGVDASAMGGDAWQGWMRAWNELPEIVAPFGLLPQQLVVALVQGAHERVVRNEQTGEQEPILRADDLARLAATCRYFRSFIEELAQDCIRAREIPPPRDSSSASRIRTLYWVLVEQVSECETGHFAFRTFRRCETGHFAVSQVRNRTLRRFRPRTLRRQTLSESVWRRGVHSPHMKGH